MTPDKTLRGRPVLPTEQRRDYAIQVRVSADAYAKWRRLGGADWLRAVLKRAKETV